MLEDTYYVLKKNLSTAGVFRINNLYGALTVLAELVFFALGVFLLHQVPAFSIAYWILQILLGISLFRFFAILHECGHKTLFRQKYLNTLVGYLVSPFCLLPYIAWRNIHYDHHKWVGVIDKDPTQAHLLKLKESRTLQNLFRILWKSWLPIGFIKFTFEVFWLYPVQEFKEGHRRNGWQGLQSVVIAGLPHLVLIISLGVGRYLTLFGPMLLIFYVWIENMNLPQHSGLFPYLSDDHPQPIPYAEQDAITRTTRLPKVLSIVFAYNFNLHIEHHLFPFVPWYFLPRVRQAIQGTQGLAYTEADFLRFMAKMRSHDPVDIYVKSLPPHAADKPSAMSETSVT
jgi:omega-6 fatty acid desaturase (delta-12 desaturase)